MSYNSGAAFRRALENRLLAQSRQSGVALVRLRKLVAFDRLLARLTAAQPGQWLLKGGVALQLRLGSLARTTRDMDVLLARPSNAVYAALTHAARLELADWFEFTVAAARGHLPGIGEGGLRFPVTALLDGRVFERFHVDVGSGDPVVEPADILMMPPLLAFAGIAPATVSCYPLSQHIAEKVHAYVRPHVTGPQHSRARPRRPRDDCPLLLGGRREAARGPAGHVRGARSGGLAAAPA